MTLAKYYSISTRYQRSTRIDSDLAPLFFAGLVYHGTAQTALETLIRQYTEAGQSAYTLTGPYGSGKSTIALLLTGLLNHNSDIREAAYKVLNTQTIQLLGSAQVLNVEQGWLQIRAVGGVHAPVDTYWAATIDALRNHPNTGAFVDKYQAMNPSTEAELINLWELLFNELNKFVDGVLLLSDEMGKTLEFINKNQGELHLFQDLAEVLSRIKTPVIFLGLLHQAFSEYVKDRGTKLQEEWGKIQGRYADIAYNVSADETASLIAQSIKPSKNAPQFLQPLVKQTLEALSGTPKRLNVLQTRLSACAPLHPLTTLLLGPLSKRRFSQNERSTFSFLNSHEMYSFHHFLLHTTDAYRSYDLADLWDYLETNLEHLILGSPDGHAWAEAADAISRADIDEQTLCLLKSIALINLFGRSAGMYATDATLMAALRLDSKEQLKQCLDSLVSSSCITYRKHLSSWAIFEGSDIDLAKLIADKLDQLHDSYESILHVDYSAQTIAKGHYHELGVLRWAEQNLAVSLDAPQVKDLKGKRTGEFANLVLLLQPTEPQSLKKLSKQEPSLILAATSMGEEILALANEVYALMLIKADSEAGTVLQHDRVAKREYESRFSDAKRQLTAVIEEAFVQADWFVAGELYTSESLSELVTKLAGQIYNQSPRILSELVNKNKISGTAVAARKKLLEAMLDYPDEDSLGIDGFPPEKSMYISCLKQTGLHVAGKSGWYFSLDQATPEIQSLFKSTTRYLKEHAGKKVILSEIEKSWNNEPYGVTKGITPILLLAYLSTLGSSIAFYERDLANEFAFIPEPDTDYVHKLQKNTDELAVKYIVLEKQDREWLKQLSFYAATLTTEPVKADLLSVATPFVTMIYGLPHWVKNSNNLVKEDKDLNAQVLAVRDLFLQANDPHTLLIQDLVGILDSKNQYSHQERIATFEKSITLLKQSHEKMLAEFNQYLSAIFSEDREQLIAMCEQVEEKSGNLRLRSFARELSKSRSFGSKWLESLISVVTGRSMQSWNENSLLTARQKINEYAEDFLRIVKASDDLATVTESGTRTVSLVLENDQGKLVNYQKEIRVSQEDKLEPVRANVQSALSALSDFERVDLLQQLLKKELDTKGS